MVVAVSSPALHTSLRAVIAVCLAAALSACGDPPVRPNCSIVPDACTTSGVTQCSADGASVRTCTPREDECLAWVTVQTCDGGSTCGYSGGSVTCIACRNTCASSATRCDGDTLQKCKLRPSGCRDWVSEGNCAELGHTCTMTEGDATCVGAGCVDDCVKTGGTQCSGNIIQTCSLGTDGCLDWVNGTDCAATAQFCDDSGTSAVCSATCVHKCPQEGASKCSGTVIQTCETGTNGCRDWVTGTDCMTTAQACDDENGTAACSDTCVDRCPTAVNKRCYNNAVESCVTGMSGCRDWVLQTNCTSSGQTCTATSGTPQCVSSCDECPAVGNTRCFGTKIQTCQLNASNCRKWVDGTDCNATGQVCTYPSGTAACGGVDFREETIYFMITTRFYNGDPANDYYNRDVIELGDPQWRGDFKGLIQQLDYIKDLGFTAIWITPVVTNRSGLDYHGYHAYDFTEVDPRYESTGATYQDLINEAHNRGIKIIQDIVINHSSNYGIRNKVHIARAPIKYFREQGKVPATDPAQPYQTNLGDYKSPSREDCDNPLAPDVFRTPGDPAGNGPITCPVCGGTISSTYSGTTNHAAGHFFNPPSADNSLGHLDSTWYHQSGYMSGGDWENATPLQQKHMAGDCMDLNTENATVKDYVMSAYDRYLDMGVDAFRVDTVKHIERSNLLEYINHFKAHKPGVFIFGENLVKGEGFGSECGGDNASMIMRPWYYTTTYSGGGCPGGQVEDSGFAVLDFSLFSTFRNNLSNGNYDGIAGIFNNDHLYGDATKLVTFLDNHDVGPDNDWKSRFKGSDQQLAAALNLLWTARGIPCLFYGTEARFKSAGEPIEPGWNGGKLNISQSGRAYFGDALTPANIAATKNHPIYQHIKRLNAIRRAVPALQKGKMEQYGGGGGSFYMVRNYNNGESYAVVGLSQGGDSFTVNGVRDGNYKDVVSGNSITVSGGTIRFGVGGGSAGIYVLNGPGKVGSDGTWLK